MRILIVDDSLLGRSYIFKVLSIMGLKREQVLEASNGMEALELLSRETISHIFLDINMPVMNGIEMVDKMFENGMIGKTQVIITSSLADPLRVEMLGKKGVRHFLRKPFTPELLKEIFESASEDGI